MKQDLYINDRNGGFTSLSFDAVGLGCDRRGYLNYKMGSKNNMTEDRLLEFKILDLLEKIGLSTNEVGTYLYKDVILNAINYLNNSKEDLISNLENKYSQFYVDIARNELEMGITTFHNYIKNAFDKRNLKKIDINLVYQIFEKIPVDMDITTQTFILAEYVYDNLMIFEQKDVKQKILLRVNN